MNEPTVADLRYDAPRVYRIEDRDLTNGRLHRISSTKNCAWLQPGYQYPLE
jgi:hypothetical protein